MNSCTSVFLQMRLLREGERELLRPEVGDFKSKIVDFFVFIHWHGATAANLLTNDALDPQALIPEFKACAVQVFPAREEELANPEVDVRRGMY